MNQFKITYTYTTMRGLVIEGKCLILAQNEKEALTRAKLERQKIELKILSIKRAN